MTKERRVGASIRGNEDYQYYSPAVKREPQTQSCMFQSVSILSVAVKSVIVYAQCISKKGVALLFGRNFNNV